MNESLQIFRDKKILITGHTGFKGSWLTFLLNEVGAKVVGFSLPPETQPNHYDLLDLNQHITNIVGDIRDFEHVSKTINDFKPEFVFHLAAQALVRPSYSDPITTFSTNILGSMNVLESVRQVKSVRSLVFVTSDKCYENDETIRPYIESDKLGGHDPYSASKAGAEIVFSSYLNSFFTDQPSLGAASVRAGNVIGGGDWSLDRVVPDLVRAIDSGVSVKLRNPKALRPWQHVLDPISGYLLLASKLYQNPKEYSGSWNFGPALGETFSVETLVERIIKSFGKGSVQLDEPTKNPHEAHYLQLDSSKAASKLGWQPKWDLDTAVESTVDWYKRLSQGTSADILTKAQINEYFK